MNNSVRVIIGLLLAPALPPVVIFSFMRIFMFPWNSLTDATNEALSSALLFMWLGYPAALLIGVPVLLLLHRKKITGLRNYLVSGAWIGLLSGGIFFGLPMIYLWTQSPPGTSFFLAFDWGMWGLILLGLIYGAIACVVYWFIAVRDNSQAAKKS